MSDQTVYTFPDKEEVVSYPGIIPGMFFFVCLGVFQGFAYRLHVVEFFEIL